MTFGLAKYVPIIRIPRLVVLCNVDLSSVDHIFALFKNLTFACCKF
jgi:hypothetical protein